MMARTIFRKVKIPLPFVQMDPENRGYDLHKRIPPADALGLEMRKR